MPSKANATRRPNARPTCRRNAASRSTPFLPLKLPDVDVEQHVLPVNVLEEVDLKPLRRPHRQRETTLLERPPLLPNHPGDGLPSPHPRPNDAPVVQRRIRRVEPLTNVAPPQPT